MSVLKPYYKIKESYKEPTVKTNKKNTKKDINPKSFSGYSPLDLANLYNFPEADGTGQTVGIIELGGGYNMSDITTYLTNLGIDTSSINITDVSINGAVNDPSDTSGANYEVVLDLEIIVALVPKAHIKMYFAPNSFSGFYNAISTAMIDNCNVISISWGAPEKFWSSTNLNAYNNLFNTAVQNGITIFAASGDNGSSDGTAGLNVDFPSSSPYAVACGGTTLTVNNSNIVSEVVWNGSGGGVSSFFDKPSYQNNITFLSSQNKRGTPDICANADPNTGYKIYIDGQYYIIGGTSAVSPLWSALTARVNQLNGSHVGFLQSKLYSSSSNVCSDIISGSNGNYTAQTNWDCCTGWGSPCSSLFQYFQNLTLIPNSIFSVNTTTGVAPLTINFIDSSTNSPTSWLWSFGNGDMSNLQNPSYTFTTGGNFTVSLTASNTYGSTTSTRNISVQVSATRPISRFTALSVTFANTSLNNPTSFHWDFGDRSYSTERNPTHVYSKVGTYTVKLTSSNSAGSNTFTKIITLK